MLPITEVAMKRGLLNEELELHSHYIQLTA
jgi:hypothetical protein